MKSYTPCLVAWGMTIALLDYELIPEVDARNLARLEFCNAYSAYHHLQLF